jgi:hypothetical protein
MAGERAWLQEVEAAISWPYHAAGPTIGCRVTRVTPPHLRESTIKPQSPRG